jgi:hypothetical protein
MAGEGRQGLLFCKKEAKNSYPAVAALTDKSFLVLFLEKGLLAFEESNPGRIGSR